MDTELQTLIAENDLIITINDVREVYGKCNSWKLLLDQRGYNVKEVLKNGIKASELLTFDDVMVTDVIRKKYGNNAVQR